MEKIQTQIHTIILLIGPSGSGKSTFAKNVLIPQLQKPFNKEKNYQPNVQYISSDKIRSQMIGYEADKFDNIMTESSELAFKMLFTQLDLVTTYPINAEFVILDTTGLSETFRNQVIEIAKKNNYNLDAIIFDYKKVEDYKQNFTSTDLSSNETSGKIIADHMKRLRNDVMKTIKRETYKNITKIKSKDFLKEENGKLIINMEIEVKNEKQYENNILSYNYDWITIGDVHGCINELKELIKKYGFEIDDNGIIIDTEKTQNKGIIFIGDLIDKASLKDIEETINFINKNISVMKERFQLIMGNHEEMVWKWTTKHESLQITPERIEQRDKWYNTTLLLEEKPEIKEQFFEMFSKMKPWVKLIGTNKRSFVVTHAPCEIKYLEKMDKKSRSFQYKSTSRSVNSDKTNDELTEYLVKEAVSNHPFHVFGHMGQKDIRIFKNKICIDTGCIYGHKLIGITLSHGKPIIQSVPYMGTESKENDFGNELFSFSKKEEFHNVDIKQLSESNQKRMDYIIKNKICYIGGTISPADKDEETHKLESLKKGLDYYKGKCETVVLQPKYMGSRAQFYIEKDIEKCYATSRNGYKIKTELKTVFNEWQIKLTNLFKKYNASQIILDGELMPWSAMGEELIDSHFKVVDKGIKSEIDFLKENGFDEAFNKLCENYKNTDYNVDKNNMNKKQLMEKYGHQYNNFKDLAGEMDRFVSIEKHEEAWKTYHEQIEIYGDNSSEIHYKAFRILKIIDMNGNIVNIDMTNEEQFKSINDDSVIVVDFSPESYKKAEYWYAKLVSMYKMEGCVIKPNKTKEGYNNIAPYMKVRNRDYLTIIYGYDMYFDKKFDKLFKQKSINRKIKASINEYNIGEKMLKSNIESSEFKQLIANFMFENEAEITIDPRL